MSYLRRVRNRFARDSAVDRGIEPGQGCLHGRGSLRIAGLQWQAEIGERVLSRIEESTSLLHLDVQDDLIALDAAVVFDGDERQVAQKLAGPAGLFALREGSGAETLHDLCRVSGGSRERRRVTLLGRGQQGGKALVRVGARWSAKLLGVGWRQDVPVAGRESNCLSLTRRQVCQRGAGNQVEG